MKLVSIDCVNKMPTKRQEINMNCLRFSWSLQLVIIAFKTTQEEENPPLDLMDKCVPL